MGKDIIVIVADDDDRVYWKPYMTAVSESVMLIRHHDLGEALESISDKPPALIAISSMVYPTGDSDLVAKLEKRFSRSDILVLVASDAPLPPTEPIVRDKIRHMVINPDNQSLQEHEEKPLVSLAIRKIAERGQLTLDEYLLPGTDVHECHITSSDQKEDVITSLETSISGDSMEVELLRQKGALLADEMLENALYGAPRTANGGACFVKGIERHLSTLEEIKFRYGFDGTTLAMEVTDSWGSLSPEVVWENLTRNLDDDDFLERADGRGLFIMWRFLDHLHIHIDPGRQTVVGGQVKLMTAENLPDKKGLHITTNGRE